jgi:hypothetical protein
MAFTEFGIENMRDASWHLGILALLRPVTH